MLIEGEEGGLDWQEISQHDNNSSNKYFDTSHDMFVCILLVEKVIDIL